MPTTADPDPSPPDAASPTPAPPLATVTDSGSWPRRLTAAIAFTALTVWQPFLAGTLAVLLALIVAHEAGHYIAARRCGMSAPNFSVGFGPVLWGRTMGETTWALRALPVGGSVRILGMSDREHVAACDEPLTYRAQPAWKRVTVSAAGPAANLLVAGLLLTIVYVGWGRSTETMVVELVQRSSPASLADIRPGDQLTAIDRIAVDSMPSLRDVLQNSNGGITLSIIRDGRAQHVELMPLDENGRRVIGIATAKEYAPLGIGTAALQAGDDVVQGTILTFGRLGGTLRSFGSYLTAPLTGDVPEGDRMVSAVGIAAIAEQVRFDLPWLLSMAASINISLAAFNLLPVPPLDGGHIVVATAEGAVSTARRQRTRINQRVLLPIALAMWGVAMLLGLSAIWLDIGATR